MNINVNFEIVVFEKSKFEFILKKNRALKKTIKKYKIRIKKNKNIIKNNNTFIEMLKREKKKLLYNFDKKKNEFLKTNNRFFELY